MGNKKKARVKKTKNRGGERLQEWRVFNSFGLTSKTTFNPREISEDKSTESAMDVQTQELVVESGSGISQTDFCGSVVSGRRIVDIHFLFKQFQKLSDHCPQFGCTLSNVILKSETKKGLKSGFIFQCNMCGVNQTVWSEPEESEVIDINKAAVVGTMSLGGGFAALEKLLGAMNVRCMSNKTYDKYHGIVSKGWEETALKEMREAAEEEIKLARERGDVDQDGTPLLTVVTDGSWAKRSYRKNYNSLSGMVS